MSNHPWGWFLGDEVSKGVNHFGLSLWRRPDTWRSFLVHHDPPGTIDSNHFSFPASLTKVTARPRRCSPVEARWTTGAGEREVTTDGGKRSQEAPPRGCRMKADMGSSPLTTASCLQGMVSKSSASRHREAIQLEKYRLHNLNYLKVTYQDTAIIIYNHKTQNNGIFIL